MRNISWKTLFGKMSTTERKLNKLEEATQIQKKLEHICLFGHIDFPCSHIQDPESEEYCINGKYRECKHYQKQIVMLEEIYNS